ncbi:hypothetical protein DBB34_14550 [Sphaerisporangium cinnabarinum]|nr:hypothetical protein [Sphaerisporangium cinnabarinum]PTU55373.1 hypothetical protein DBB34_14550 [Sphaerisporangium cinnabarinum]
MTMTEKAPITEAEVAAKVAAAFGRDRFGREMSPGARELARIDEARATTAREIGLTDDRRPWRNHESFSVTAEAVLVDLVSTRRGQTKEAAGQHVDGVLREAWNRPGAIGSTDVDRLASVVRELEESIERLSKLSPIVQEGKR